MRQVLGLGKLDRQELTSVLQATKGTISIRDTSEILHINSSDAAKKLARWAKNGWLCRIKQGLYIPVPLESEDANVAMEDAWVIANRIYDPCYIGGWSAAEYWELTEQIFLTVIVMTTQKVHQRQVNYQNVNFRIKTIPDKHLFGLKNIWRGQVKVKVSDPARTLIDMLSDPSLGGGMRLVSDMLKNFFQSEQANQKLLLEYAKQFKKGVIFKRLGYLTEKFFPEKKNFINSCLLSMSAGYSKLDPSLSTKKLVTRWRLWLPENWENKKK
jgi:predicted transcriptional regulator of viral defense system